MNIGMIAVLMTILINPSMSLAEERWRPLETFMNSYIEQSSEGKAMQLEMSQDFSSHALDDENDFRECGKGVCRVRLRETPVLKTNDKDKQLWEVRLDVVRKGGETIRRSGCYLIEKSSKGFVLNDYIYECFEK